MTYAKTFEIIERIQLKLLTWNFQVESIGRGSGELQVAVFWSPECNQLMMTEKNRRTFAKLSPSFQSTAWL